MVYLVKEDIPPFIKANILYNEEVKRVSIRRLIWPLNSLNLSIIADTFTDIKKEIKTYGLTFLV